MCLYNATIVKADFKVKKFWKTFLISNSKVFSVIYNVEYKKGWNYPNPEVTDLWDAGIHCFDNCEDVKRYKDSWDMKQEVICPVYCLGSDIIAVGQTDIHCFKSLKGSSTTFRKVFIRHKDYEKLLKGESVHD